VPDTTTDIALADHVNPLALVDDAWTKEQQKQMAAFVGVSEDNDAFRPFLGIAAALGLSPLLGEIWLIEGQEWDPEIGDYVTVWKPAVGRDGFLKKAEESKNFAALRSGTVCANDTFEVEDDGEQVKILHRFKSLGPDVEKGKESRYRGKVVGGWAKVFFKDGRPPMFYYAPAHEHVKTITKDGGVEFAGAWSYTSAMVEKAAQSRVLRLGFRITGVVPADEIRADEFAGNDPAARQMKVDPMIENSKIISEAFPGDAHTDLRETLIARLGEVNDLSPFSWAPAKVAMVISAGDVTGAEKVIGQIERELDALRDQAGERAEREAAREAEEAEIAVEVVKAKDAVAPFELKNSGGESQWMKVREVNVPKRGKVTFIFEDGNDLEIGRTTEIEIRRPAPSDPQD
jgi:hypothetical protein